MTTFALTFAYVQHIIAAFTVDMYPYYYARLLARDVQDVVAL